MYVIIWVCSCVKCVSSTVWYYPGKAISLFITVSKLIKHNLQNFIIGFGFVIIFLVFMCSKILLPCAMAKRRGLSIVKQMLSGCLVNRYMRNSSILPVLIEIFVQHGQIFHLQCDDISTCIIVYLLKSHYSIVFCKICNKGTLQVINMLSLFITQHLTNICAAPLLPYNRWLVQRHS